ncbi:MAG TPA: hypothetical protein VG273_10370 [Bryobacteraceae bacterium]|nr:hypothetical protein [Bryobacteraceae bacterium]
MPPAWGAAEGVDVGLVFGAAVGDAPGAAVGDAFGAAVGEAFGVAVGEAVGDAFGAAVGDAFGADGDALGAAVGDATGGTLVPPALAAKTSGMLLGNGRGTRFPARRKELWVSGFDTVIRDAGLVPPG